MREESGIVAEGGADSQLRSRATCSNESREPGWWNWYTQQVEGLCSQERAGSNPASGKLGCGKPVNEVCRGSPPTFPSERFKERRIHFWRGVLSRANGKDADHGDGIFSCERNEIVIAKVPKPPLCLPHLPFPARFVKVCTVLRKGVEPTSKANCFASRGTRRAGRCRRR